MALRPDIILAGQPIDIVGSMSRGNELATQTNQLQDQNALRQVYKTQGAGLLSGNQSSLNALAAIDPNLALGVQGGVLQNQTAQRSFEIMNAQEKRAIAEAAAQMDEREKAEAAASVKQEVMRFIAAPTPEIFDQMVTQAGKPELAGMWANRQVLGAEYVSSVEEALKLSQGPAGPEWAAATPEEAQARGAEAGQINRRTGEFKATPKAASTNVTVNNAGEGEFDKAFAKEDATLLGQISAAGIAAQRNIGRIDQLGALLEETPTGAGAAAKRWLGERGIATEGLSEIQAIQAAINSLVPEQRQPGSGPMSDADLALFKESLPRLINQPGGNQIIVDTMRAIAQYDAEGAVIAQRLRSGEITRAQAFDALQNRKNPLDDFKIGIGQPQSAPTAPQAPAVPSGNAGGVNWRIVQ